jgi:hypothetical protein
VFQDSITAYSRDLSLVEVDQTAEALTAADTAIGAGLEADWKRDNVPQALVVALGVVVLDKLLDGAAQMTLAERTMCRRHSCLIDRTNLSAYALRFGLFAGRRSSCTPAACRQPGSAVRARLRARDVGAEGAGV